LYFPHFHPREVAVRIIVDLLKSQSPRHRDNSVIERKQGELSFVSRIFLLDGIFCCSSCRIMRKIIPSGKGRISCWV
jgi:hypothetical protein